MRTGDGGRRVSEPGKRLIRNSEGLRLTAYLCSSRKPTIGYGHTGPDVTHKDVGKLTITLDKAEQLLDNDIKWAESYVSKIRNDFNQNQFDALVSFVFNNGSCGSGLLAALKARDWERAGKLWMKYIHADAGPKCMGRCGRVGCTVPYAPGLIARRKEEWELFTRK